MIGNSQYYNHFAKNQNLRGGGKKTLFLKINIFRSKNGKNPPLKKTPWKLGPQISDYFGQLFFF